MQVGVGERKRRLGRLLRLLEPRPHVLLRRKSQRRMKMAFRPSSQYTDPSNYGASPALLFRVFLSLVTGSVANISHVHSVSTLKHAFMNECVERVLQMIVDDVQSVQYNRESERRLIYILSSVSAASDMRSVDSNQPANIKNERLLTAPQ